MIIKALHFIKVLIKSNKLFDTSNLLIIIACLILTMVSVNIYAIYQSDLVIAVNSNVENRTFKLSYPLDKDIEVLMETFGENRLLEDLSFISEEGFDSFIVTYTLYDYRDRVTMDLQFTDFSDAISFFESNLNFESMFMFKISKYIQLFLILTVIVALLLLNTVNIRILKDLKLELTLLNALGYNKLILFVVSFLKVMITFTIGFFFTLICERLLIRQIITELFIKSSLLVDFDVEWYLNLGKSMMLYHLILLTISVQLAFLFKKGHTIGKFNSFKGNI